MMTWRDRATPLIREILALGLGEAEERKKLRDAFPFGVRIGRPYRVWLDQIARLKGRKHLVDPRKIHVPNDLQLELPLTFAEKGLLAQRWWPRVRQFIRLQLYGRDPRPTAQGRTPRIRIELEPLPTELYPFVLNLTMPCVSCGNIIHPFRFRRSKTGARHMYYAACCPLSSSYACSRGPEARKEYQRVRDFFEVDKNIEPPLRPSRRSRCKNPTCDNPVRTVVDR